MKKVFAIAIAISIVFLTACSSRKEPKETEPPYTAAPTTEAYRATERETPVEPKTTETPITTDAEMTEPSKTKPADPKIGFPEELDEPPAPVRDIDITVAEQGIENRDAMMFFKTISTNPVYYHYLHHAAELPESDITVALNFDQSYLKIEQAGAVSEYLCTGEQNYYRLERERKEAIPVTIEEAMGHQISMVSFEQLYDNAQNLYFVGSGIGKFQGQSCAFEEYTQTGSEFVRYYFRNDQVWGHRVFEDGELVSEVVILALKNYVDDMSFEIPEELTVITPPEQTVP